MSVVSIKNCYCKILGDFDPQISGKLYEGLTYGDPADLEFRTLYDPRNRVFPTGVLDTVLRIMAENGEIPTFEDKRIKITSAGKFPYDPKHPARPYQEQDIKSMLKTSRGIVRLPTGGGKTFISGAYIADLSLSPTLFLVHRTTLLDNAYEDFLEQFPKEYVGRLGGGYFEIDRPIVVAMLPTIASALRLDKSEKITTEQAAGIIDLLKRAAVVIGDEAHHIPAAVSFNILTQTTSAYRKIALSATPWRADGMDLLIEAAFGKRIVDRSASELADLGFLVNPDIKMVRVPYRAAANGITDWAEIQKHGIVENTVRNKIAIAEILDMYEKGRNIGVFVNMIQHGKNMLAALRALLPTHEVEFVEGATSSLERNRIFRAARTGRVRISVLTSLADEGLDIPAMNGICLADGGKSSVEKIQQIGRGLRIHPSSGKFDCDVRDFYDEVCPILKRHSDERVSLYQTIERNWTVSIRNNSLGLISKPVKTASTGMGDW